jgi:ABC-2 type transport system permease protein
MTSRPLERSALYQLSYTRMLAFLREPEAVFWVFAFPLLLALALGIAFRNAGPQRTAIAVERGPDAERLAGILRASPDLEVQTLAPSDAEVALRRGKAVLLVRPTRPPALVFDPARPETRLAEALVKDVLERDAGRRDVLTLVTDTRARPGSRYIDFLIPGLIGLNLLGTGMWGIGFPIANARQLKLLKRMIATPMRRSDFLLSLLVARIVWLVLEVVAIVAFGWLVFDVQVRGSWPAFVAITLVGGLAFSTMGLLVASRARTVEGVSGLMNFVMMPMWLLGGSFFSAERFPAVMQPFIQALPLTAANDALRALMNEGAGALAVMPDLAILAAWMVVSFWLALVWFRWE